MLPSNLVSQSVAQVKINRRYFALLREGFVSFSNFTSQLNTVQSSNATFQPVTLRIYSRFHSR